MATVFLVPGPRFQVFQTEASILKDYGTTWTADDLKPET